MRNILVGMVVAIAAAAPAAAVQTVTITSAGIYNPGSVDATLGGTTKSELAAVLHFRGGSVYLNSPARLLSGAAAVFMPLREAVG